MSGRPHVASRHWRNQRLSSVALVPLGLWFLVALLRQPSLDHAAVTSWLGRPLQALLAALLGAALLWHSLQGWQVVLEDYLRGPTRGFGIALARIVHAAAAIVLAAALFRLVGGAGA